MLVTLPLGYVVSGVCHILSLGGLPTGSASAALERKEQGACPALLVALAMCSLQIYTSLSQRMIIGWSLSEGKV